MKIKGISSLSLGDISWYFSAFTKRIDWPEFCIPLKSFFSFPLLSMLVVVLPKECGLLKRPVSRDFILSHRNV